MATKPTIQVAVYENVAACNPAIQKEQLSKADREYYLDKLLRSIEGDCGYMWPAKNLGYLTDSEYSQWFATFEGKNEGSLQFLFACFVALSEGEDF